MILSLEVLLHGMSIFLATATVGISASLVTKTSTQFSLFYSFVSQAVAQILTESSLRGQVFGGTWPLATDACVEETLDKAIVTQGMSLSYKPLIRNLAESRAQIRQKFIEMENKQIEELAESLQNAFNISAGTLSQAAVRSYLDNNYPNAEHALLQEIVAGKNRFGLFLFPTKISISRHCSSYSKLSINCHTSLRNDVTIKLQCRQYVHCIGEICSNILRKRSSQRFGGSGIIVMLLCPNTDHSDVPR